MSVGWAWTLEGGGSRGEEEPGRKRGGRGSGEFSIVLGKAGVALALLLGTATLSDARSGSSLVRRRRLAGGEAGGRAGTRDTCSRVRPSVRPSVLSICL